MELGLRDKVALVGGASQGIGRAVAEALAAEGARCVLVARGRERLERAAQEIGARTGAPAAAVAGDLSAPDDVPRIVAEATRAHRRIDILVTNAGGPPAGLFEETSMEAWRKAFDLTFLSVVALCRETLPGMRSRGFGRIVHLTSVSTKQPLERLVLSNALRAAVTGLSKTLANEAGKDGVTVNCVAPGFTATERLGELASATAKARGTSESEVRAGWIASTPAGRLGEPSEVGSLVAFLASERAAYINGTVIAVDGGLSRGLL